MFPEIRQPAGTSENYADHACQTCRRQKRKCTKELPKCLLCTRLSRACIYGDTSPSPQDEIRALHARIAELEAALASKRSEPEPEQPIQIPSPSQTFTSLARNVNTNPLQRFPAVFFLDFEIFQEGKMNITFPEVPIPDDIYAVLQDISGLRRIAGLYFCNTHVWFPILCRKRFEVMLDSDNFTPPPDLALLFAVMFLLNDEASNCRASTRTSIYWNIKHFANVLEANTIVTPEVSQAYILLTLYELGHAIYPAAYLSLGKCATMAKALGLDDRENAPQMKRRYGSWAKLEELRRIWWAVVLLDRYGFPCIEDGC